MFEFLSLSLSSLKRRKLRSALTMLGIIIGIAAVVSLISLGNGLRTAITGQFGTLSPDRLMVQNSGTGFGPPGSTAIRKLTDHDVNLIKNVNGVLHVVPRLVRIVKVEYNKASAFYYVMSVPQTQEDINLAYEAMDNAEAGDGRLLKAGDRGEVVVGSGINGDAFGKKIRVGTKLTVQGKEFEVVGILKPSSSVQFNQMILVPEKDLKNILNIGDEWDVIGVRVASPSQAEQVAARISQVLRRDRNEKVGEEDFSVQTPLQAISSVSTILNIINLIVAGIAAISLIVGGIGIANTMYTSVLERTKEIGTMKAVGARNSNILYIFVFESGLLGLVGGIIGAGVGLGMALLVSAGANAAFGSSIIDVSVSWPLLFEAVSFSFGIGLVSGWFPARQASKLKPVDALRG